MHVDPHFSRTSQQADIFAHIRAGTDIAFLGGLINYVLQNELYFGGLRQTLGSATLAALDKAISPQDWNTLFLSSPEFMR